MKWCILILLLFVFNTSIGQRKTTGLWISSGLSHDLFSGMSVKIEEGLRFTDNTTDQTFTDLSLRYKVSDYLQTTLTWRNGQRGGMFNTEHIDNRFQIDVAGRYDYEDLSFRIRGRFQSRYRDIYTSKEGMLSKNHLRTRFRIKYDLFKDIELEVGSELFYGTNIAYRYIDKYRIYAGIGYGFGEYHEIGFRYIFQSDVQEANPESSNIFSFSYSYDLGDMLSDRQKARKETKEEKINWYVLPDQ